MTQEPRNELSPFYGELAVAVEEAGFDDFTLAPVEDSPFYETFLERARLGLFGGLKYLTESPQTRRSPKSVLASAQTIIIVALSERRLCEESRAATQALRDAPALQPQNASDAATGAISGYASCLDYHEIVRKGLKKLLKFCASKRPQDESRAVVDTAPLLEKSWARKAGLGFCGLHTLIVHPRLGSRFFLGEALVSTPFEELVGAASLDEFLIARARLQGRSTFDVEAAERACEKCRRCVNACPTRALRGDRSLDVSRCLNYWTIESREEIPEDVASALGGRLFGCDLCQRVCPWNEGATSAPPWQASLDAVERLDDATFRKLFRKTPVFRARLEGLQRAARALRRNAQKRDDDASGEETSKKKPGDR